MKGKIKTKDKLLLIANTLQQNRAQDVQVLRMRNLCSITDYFVICSGESGRQVKSLAEKLSEALKESGIPPGHTEGEEFAKWVVMDCNDVVVHIFYRQMREFYSLETLWADAPHLPVAGQKK